MGIALADAAKSMGAEITLVLGPVEIRPELKDIRIVPVTTASEMAEACIRIFPECDIAILAAAVADYTPETVSKTKLKKSKGPMLLKLVPTPDIAAEIGRIKKPGQFVAGFALETENELENATVKMRKKNLDLIVLNSLRDTGAGFGYDTNRITILDKNNNIDKFELKSKKEAAYDILMKIISLTATEK